MGQNTRKLSAGQSDYTPVVNLAPFPAVVCRALDFVTIGREDLHRVQRRLMCRSPFRQRFARNQAGKSFPRIIIPHQKVDALDALEYRALRSNNCHFAIDYALVSASPWSPTSLIATQAMVIPG
jgi:hypothetical protein